MNGILDLIKTRQSARSFTGEEISTEKLMLILEAGRLAPSARNTQPWRFYATQNRDLLNKLGESFSKIGRNLFVIDASAVIAITEEPLPEGVEMRRRYAEYDIGMAIMQICLEAEALGVGSCILGTFCEEDVKSILEIPVDRNVAMVICLGVSAEECIRPKMRKDFDEAVIIR